MRCIRAIATDDGLMSTLKEPRYRLMSLLNWSPDGRYLAYRSRGSDSGDSVLLGVTGDAPSFWLAQNEVDSIQWSSDSKTLLYVGGDELQRVSISESLEALEVGSTGGMVNNPAWAFGHGNYIQVVAQEESTSLVLGETPDGADLPPYPLDNKVVLASSPDRKRLAIMEQRRGVGYPPSGPVTVTSLVDTGDSKRFPLAGESMFWSPDNKHIAIYVEDNGETISESERVHLPGEDRARDRARWWIMDTDSGKYFPLVAFYPPESYQQLVQSESDNPGAYQIWNPTGTQLVLATLPTEGDKAELWIVDVSGDRAPKALGKGDLAIWSWQ